MGTGTGPDEEDVELVRILGNKYSAEILGATGEPRSAQELSDRLDVPIATCYRRIEELSDAGLLTLEDSILSEERRRVDVYRRGVDRVTVTFVDGGVDIEIEERSSVKNRIDDAWRTLTE